MQHITYMEKLERLYVLTETRNMLQQRLEQLENNSGNDKALIVKDLEKIKEEINIYSGGLEVDQIENFSTQSLFNPSVLEE